MTYTGHERRKSVLTDDDRYELARLVVEVSGVQDHAAHHQWIEAQIKRDTSRAQFWEGMKAHVAKWGAVSVLTLLGYLIWQGFKHYVR